MAYSRLLLLQYTKLSEDEYHFSAFKKERTIQNQYSRREQEVKGTITKEEAKQGICHRSRKREKQER